MKMFDKSSGNIVKSYMLADLKEMTLLIDPSLFAKKSCLELPSELLYI